MPYPVSETTYPWSSHSCIAHLPTPTHTHPPGRRGYSIGCGLNYVGNQPFSLTSLSLVISTVCSCSLSGFATRPALTLLSSSLAQPPCFSLSGALASRAWCDALSHVAVSAPALFPQLCCGGISGPGEHFPATW